MVILELSVPDAPLTKTHLERIIAPQKNKLIKDRVFFIRPSRGLQSLEESTMYNKVDEASTQKHHRKN
jgi:hypothetical protein